MSHQPLDRNSYVEMAIQRASTGDTEAGLEVLRLCQEMLVQRKISDPLCDYLAQRLQELDKAIKENDSFGKVKSSSGSIRSDRLAAIESALGIAKQSGRPKNPFPDWQEPYAAIGIHLQLNNTNSELINSTLDLIRRQQTGGTQGLDRSQASRILKSYAPLKKLDRGSLSMMAKPLKNAFEATSLGKNVAEKIADLFDADN